MRTIYAFALSLVLIINAFVAGAFTALALAVMMENADQDDVETDAPENPEL